MSDETGRGAILASVIFLTAGFLVAVAVAAFGYLQGGGVVAFICGFLGLCVGHDGFPTVILEVVFRERTLRQGVQGCLALGLLSGGNLLLAIAGIVLMFLGLR